MHWFLKFLFIQDGMQREIFLKLLAKLEEHCKNVLIGSEIDYRRLIAQRSIDQVRSKQVLLLSPLVKYPREKHGIVFK